MPNLSNFWTQSEISFLKENYRKIKLKDLAIQLRRPLAGVRNKIQNLKLNGHLNYVKDNKLLDLDKSIFKVKIVNTNVTDYLESVDHLTATERFMKKIKNNLNFIRCTESVADIICQQNDIKRTTMFFKFVKKI